MAYYNNPLYVPFKSLLSRRNLSLRAVSKEANISRGCLSQILAGEVNGDVNDVVNVELASLARLTAFLDQTLVVLSHPNDSHSSAACSTLYSTVAVSLAVERDGFESWKIHYFNLVDEFRRTLDPRLILLPPPPSLDNRLKALLASIVTEIALEAKMNVPSWACRRQFLPQPWFLSGMESLKAMALIESPLPFRNNNIFVLQNFLARA